MNSLLGFFYDGGPIFTFTILLVLIVILFFFIKGLVTNGDNKKIIDLMELNYGLVCFIISVDEV